MSLVGRSLSAKLWCLYLCLLWFWCLEALADRLAMQAMQQPIQARRHYLFLPGLNFRAEAFADLQTELADLGHASYQLRWAYSNESPRAWQGEDLAKSWKQQMRGALAQIAAACDSDPEGEWVIVGYSLGALLAELILQQQPEAISSCLRQTIYLAPAFAVRPWLRWPLLSSQWWYGGWKVPSWNEPLYQAKHYSLVAEYRALKQLIDELAQVSPRPLPLQHLLVASPKDELIDVDYAQAFTQRSRTQANQLWLKQDRQARVGKYHLIVDRASLGEEEFGVVLEGF